MIISIGITVEQDVSANKVAQNASAIVNTNVLVDRPVLVTKSKTKTKMISDNF